MPDPDPLREAALAATPGTEAGRRLLSRLTYDWDPTTYMPGDYLPELRDAILAIEEQARQPLLDENALLRAALEGIATMLPGSVPLPMTQEQYLRAMLHEVVRKAAEALRARGAGR